MPNITKVGSNTYLYNTTHITQSEEKSSHNNGKITLGVRTYIPVNKYKEFF